MGPDIYKHDARLQEALSIAWEALEKINEVGIYAGSKHTMKKISEEAMRHIEEMGK